MIFATLISRSLSPLVSLTLTTLKSRFSHKEFNCEVLMATQLQGKKKGVRMIEKIIDLHEKGYSKKRISESLGISRSTVRKYVDLNGKDLNDSSQLVYKSYVPEFSKFIDWKSLNKQVKEGFQLKLLWEEVISNNSNKALQKVPYTTFWREYKRKYPNYPLDFHKNHKPGERIEIDYKGDANGLEFYDKRA